MDKRTKNRNKRRNVNRRITRNKRGGSLRRNRRRTDNNAELERRENKIRELNELKRQTDEDKENLKQRLQEAIQNENWDDCMLISLRLTQKSIEKKKVQASIVHNERKMLNLRRAIAQEISIGDLEGAERITDEEIRDFSGDAPHP
tara:strand:- start:618 stop:1055 length:438 start_codon:yes stop_codon:yes gene_type:complete